MNDYILKQDAIKALDKKHDELARRKCYDLANGVGEGVEVVKDIPSADVVERKYGEWMPIIDANELGEPYQCGIYCSECELQTVTLSNFCPDCGADMRERKDNE